MTDRLYSRRDFMKVGGAALIGLFVPGFLKSQPTKEMRSWKIPDTETWKSWMKDPSFLKQFAKSQFNLNEYATLDSQNQQEFASADYPGNSCGETTITMAINLYTFHKTGTNPKTTNADVINELTEKTTIIRPNGTNMTDYNLKLAFDFLVKKKVCSLQFL